MLFSLSTWGFQEKMKKFPTLFEELFVLGKRALSFGNVLSILLGFQKK